MKISSASTASSIATWSSVRRLRVHRGLPELLGVHLAEALVALDARGPCAPAPWTCSSSCSPSVARRVSLAAAARRCTAARRARRIGHAGGADLANLGRAQQLRVDDAVPHAAAPLSTSQTIAQAPCSSSLVELGGGAARRAASRLRTIAPSFATARRAPPRSAKLVLVGAGRISARTSSRVLAAPASRRRSSRSPGRA